MRPFLVGRGKGKGEGENEDRGWGTRNTTNEEGWERKKNREKGA